MSEPLIYTSNGNVPEKSLSYDKRWSRYGEFIRFEEFWYDEQGTVVKNNVHVAHQDAIGEHKEPSNDVTIGLQGAGIGGEQALMS